jgi:hypothetical protein
MSAPDDPRTPPFRATSVNKSDPLTWAFPLYDPVPTVPPFARGSRQSARGNRAQRIFKGSYNEKDRSSFLFHGGSESSRGYYLDARNSSGSLHGPYLAIARRPRCGYCPCMSRQSEPGRLGEALGERFRRAAGAGNPIYVPYRGGLRISEMATLTSSGASQWPVFTGFDVVGAWPGLITGEVDVFPSQR